MEADADDSPSSPASFTMGQQKALAIFPRISACASLVSGLCILAISWKHRQRVYHRLMMGLAAHVVVWACWHIVGNAAVPRGTPDIWGAHGTTQTCTAQGFFFQVSFAIPFYYVFLSLYSFQAVRSNFDVSKILWIEKWIHVLVHIFPVGSAFYLLMREFFNSNGHVGCWIASIPFGCGKGTGVECTRGPQNIETIVWLFAGLPTFFVLLFPTCVMIALYLQVRSRQQSINLRAMDVARQAGLYLLAIYWAYLFAMINKGFQTVGEKRVFATALLHSVNTNLLGFYVFLIYLHFSLPGNVKPDNTVSKHSSTSRRKLFADSRHGRSSADGLSDAAQSDGSKFNIFDGTNASEAYSRWIFEGDADDEEADRMESEHWSHVQEFAVVTNNSDCVEESQESSHNSETSTVDC